MDSALRKLGKSDPKRMTRLILHTGNNDDLRRLSLRRCGIEKKWDSCSEEEKKQVTQLIADMRNKVLEQEKDSSREYSLEEFEKQLVMLLVD
jgi:hypothetical protein